ncbi:MAG: inositol monophosphatase [Proteobacteria bacterium]|nr:inositol monophosphatase [Pseudomonadota bacterium]MBI3498342.1 inositol monophosphatase [Pseudomonadota bacterium]
MRVASTPETVTPADKVELDARELALAGVIREAGRLARTYFYDRASLGLTFKGPQDYLTVADGAVERAIIERLGRAFPGDGFLGEEGGGRPAPSLWVIDPIDGTANFARGVPHFCISIAYMRNGKVELGAIYQPITDELFAARRGAGAACNGRKMQVSATKDMAQAIVELGWSKRRPMQTYTAVMERVVTAGGSFRRAGSGALGLAYVADGRSDGYAELHINSWDCLAGLIMIEEAGGWTNDFLAGNGLTEGNPVLAATPALAAAMQKATGIER